jgi:PAS domain S-box-containing protein
MMADHLRGKAEELIKPLPQSPEKEELTPEEKSRLIHDLKVHQIELEIQNEELRNTEAALNAIKDDYIRLYNQSPVGYLSLDGSAIIRQCNETFIAMIGQPENSPVGKPLADYLAEEDKSTFLGRYRAFFREPAGKDIEVALGTASKGASEGRKKGIDVRLTGKREKSQSSDLILVSISDISEQKKADRQIRALLTEKELILREVHHRVKNNMSTIMGLLSLQAGKVKEPSASEALHEARQRIETMLLIYSSLYQQSGDYKSVHLGSYIPGLLERLTATFSAKDRVRIGHDIEEIEIDASVAMNIGIIVNELVTNSFKYAFPEGTGEIKVVLSSIGEGRIRLLVTDNGVGLPEHFTLAGAEGFGLTLIQGLVSHLEGTLEHLDQESGCSFLMDLQVDML